MAILLLQLPTTTTMAETPAELAFETLKTLLFSVYYLIEAFILLFIPWSWRAKDVTEDTVLVTGAGSGIGRLMAIKFAKKGAELVLWDINEQSIQETATEIKKYGGRVSTYRCDLSKRDDIYRVAEQVKRDGHDISILVNNAGIVTGKKFLDCPDSMIEKTMEVNSMAHFWTVKAFMPAMLRKNHGHLVTVASSAGLIGVNGLADYCASKFAAVGFDESLKYELNAMGKDGVHTTVVCPYYINTGMFEGVKTRFPKILPIVEQDYAAERIVDAVLINQEIVYIPRILYFFLALKGLLPFRLTNLICDFMGNTTFMDTFCGRAKQN